MPKILEGSKRAAGNVLSAMMDLPELANRRCFDQTIQREWTRLQRTKDFLSLIMCDVDFFKLFNDTYGHHDGDDCLKWWPER